MGVLARKTSKSAGEETVRLYLHWPVEVLSTFMLLAAMHLSRRYQLSIWASLTVCAAQQARATVLWAEDLNPGQRLGDRVVRNPFRE